MNDLSEQVERIKQNDQEKLQEEYKKMVSGLRECTNKTDLVTNPAIPKDILDDNIPGGIL